MIAEIDGETYEIVGISLEGVNAQYFEFFNLDEDNETLSNVALSLLLAATITTGLGVLVGVLAARRAVRPVADASEAAKAIAGGRLETRLAPPTIPISACSPARSTTWRRRCSSASSATPASPPTCPTSCARR